MKQYFIYEGKKANGPYNLQTLKNKNISKDTPIWHKGLPEWTTAEYVAELKEVTDQYMAPALIPQLNSRFAFKMAVVVATLIGMALFYYSLNTSEGNYTTDKTILTTNK